MKTGAIIKVGSLNTYKTDIGVYDPDKLGLGPIMIQNSGSGDNAFVGPAPVTVVRPMEMSVPGAFCIPAVFQWTSSTTSEQDWEFYADNSAAAATRKILMCRFDRKTGIRNTEGFITLTFPGTSEAKTIRSLDVFYKKRSTGTVAVSGTTITGTSTLFNTEACVGSRIGFGTTNPEAVTQWYEIATVTSDTGATLTTTGPTLSAGTTFVIEDLKMAVTVTSATTTNGGVYLVKGLRREIFSANGTTIAAAASTDQQRAVYWIADAATVTNTVPFGTAHEAEIDASNCYLWVIDTLANPVLFKYNVNTPLTGLSSGKSTSAFMFKTGSGGALTGTPSQVANLTLANASHGPGSGLNCLYFTTASRVYRTSAVSTITTGSTIWLADSMTEVPAGGTSTFAVAGTLTTIAYSSVADRFLVLSSGASGAHSYFTQYNTSGSQFDRMILVDNKQIDQAGADATLSPVPVQLALGFAAACVKGMFYLARNGTTATNNHIYSVPGGADWEYAALTGNRVIFPRMATSDAAQYTQAFCNDVGVIGGSSGKNLGLATEPYRLYYRTSGITDNSGSWNPIGNNGDISGVAGAAYIQFMAEFRVMPTFVPARIQSVGLIYENTATDSHFYASATKSDSTNKRFAWLYATAFGSTVPALRVRLYDAVSGSLLVDDNTTSPTGTWELSTNDGSSWAAWTNGDRANSTTYVRYTPASLADNIKVRQTLTLL